jgi:Dolichyl-phosphate-mannose-protein mannosyltransferase
MKTSIVNFKGTFVFNCLISKQVFMTKKTIILFAFILAKFVLQYSLIIPEYDLQRDEFMHLDQANHLAWGYATIPPMTSWLASIIQLLGNTPFWVRFFPTLFGALTIVVVWKTIEALKGGLFALVLGATSVLLSVLLRLNVLFQPNSLDVLSWVSLYFMFIKFIETDKPKWLFMAAIVFAIGFLNKYNIAFLLIGLLPAILVTEQRRVFVQKDFYLALSLGLLLISPNLWWQYTHNFPVFQHLKELADRQLVNVNRWNFLKAQLLYFVGCLFVIVSALYAFWAYNPFKKYRFFFWTMLFTLTVFVYFKAKDYYAIGLYPIYIAFGSVYLESILTGWKRYLKPLAIAFPIVCFTPMYLYVFPDKSPENIVKNPKPYKILGLLRWEDGKDHAIPQDFADMLGWKELANKVETIYSAMPNQDQTMILCDNYGQAGAINYYAKNPKIKAVAFHDDYLNWFNLEQKTDNVIRIKYFQDKDDELKESSPFFETAYAADSITNPYALEHGTTIFVFKKAKVDINARIAKEIEEERLGH